jgi:hypothetical protein
MDVFNQIKKEHKKIKNLLKEVENTYENFPAIITRFLNELKFEISKNIMLEEKVFYSFLHSFYEKHDFLKAPLLDHQRIKNQIDELIFLPVDNSWPDKFNQLKSTVIDHFNKEEAEIFSIARCILTKSQIDNLSQLLKIEKLKSLKNDSILFNPVLFEINPENFYQAG